jgi:hypothetical protein
MKTKRILIIWAISLLSMSGWTESGWAAGSRVYYNFEPVFRNAIVSGDKEKFREDMWIKDGGAGGVHEFSLSQDSKDVKVEADARAIVPENDYNFNVNLKKENLFEIAGGYKEFRKYYDGTGGFYGWFRALEYIELANDLHLDDGKFFVDLRTSRPDEANYFATYERHAKTGAISALRWASVVQPVGVVATTRKIAPAWDQVDEVEHTIKFGAEGDTAFSKNIHWKAEQKLLFLNNKVKGEERRYGATVAQNGIDAQDDRAKSNSSMTTLLADSRINDWTHLSSAAYYEHTHASLLEDFTNRSPLGISQAVGTLDYFNETASSTLDVYSWTTSLLMSPLKYLSASAKIKAELKQRFSDSNTPQDTTAIPDMKIDRTTYVDSSDTFKSINESLGVRFTKLPRTTLYIDGDFEQVYGRRMEDSARTIGATSSFFRDVDIVNYRNNITAGVNWRPYNILSISSQYRKTYTDDDYDNRDKTPTGIFLDLLSAQRFNGDNFTTKVDIKPYRWIRGMFKYQWRNTDIFTATSISTLDSAKAVSNMNTYLTSVTLIPTQNFYLTGMFSRQASFTDTPARLVTIAVVPRYEADVNTAMGSATYIITPRASLEAQYQWVHAGNFNDISAFGMPYGIDNTSNRASLAFKYDIKENLSTEITYGFVNYDEKSNEGIDDYAGHIIGGKVLYTF